MSVDGNGVQRERAPLGGELLWLRDPGADGGGGLEPVVWTPGLISELLTETLGDVGLDELELTGVVSGLQRRRVCSFELVEHRGSSGLPDARVRVVMFSQPLAAAEAAMAAAGVQLIDGATATVTGAMQWDPRWGSLRVVAQQVAVLAAVSPVEQQRQDRTAALRAEGLFDRQRRLQVPARPRRVGLIAGEGTAGAADVEAVLQASGAVWELVRRSVPMAGDRAAGAVAGALAAVAAEHPEVIVIARGGGARAELACWDTEAVVRAIANCPVPVWTAIGHTHDRTLADDAAHQAWPTPSAAAAALVARVEAHETLQRRSEDRRRHQGEVAVVKASARTARRLAAMAVLLLVVVLLAQLRG